MTYDVVVAGGTIWTPYGSFVGDIGITGETIADIRDTVEFVRDLEVEVWNAKFLSPYYATPIHTITASLGYIDVWKNKPGFNGLAKQIGLGRVEGPSIKIPTIKGISLH